MNTVLFLFLSAALAVTKSQFEGFGNNNNPINEIKSFIGQGNESVEDVAKSQFEKFFGRGKESVKSGSENKFDNIFGGNKRPANTNSENKFENLFAGDNVYKTLTENQFGKLFGNGSNSIKALTENQFGNGNLSMAVSGNKFDNVFVRGDTPGNAPFPQAFSLLQNQFEEFKTKFNKVYSPDEEKLRLEIFSRNHQLIEAISNETYSFITRTNQYVDLALEEFNKLLNGLYINRAKSNGIKFIHGAEKIPTSVDLRDDGYITPIRSQGRCASCYAFASAAALESYLFKKTGKRHELSPQNIMDCTLDKPYANGGCSGGSVDPCFDFIKAKGVNAEEEYPYLAKAGKECKFQAKKSITHVNGYVLLEEGDEKALEMAIATKGPVTAGMDAHAKSFQFYGGGIYYEPKCNSSVESLNHAVLVIGYTPEYWIIKNSYGTDWGEEGFGKISRNVSNHCGIATYAIYPIV